MLRLGGGWESRKEGGVELQGDDSGAGKGADDPATDEPSRDVLGEVVADPRARRGDGEFCGVASGLRGVDLHSAGMAVG